MRRLSAKADFCPARIKPILWNHHSHVLWQPCAAAFSRSLLRPGIQGDHHILEVIEGDMSRRAQALVLEWGALHRMELRQAWDLAIGADYHWNNVEPC
jgi:hypothetical protein